MIAIIEDTLGRKAEMIMEPMQAGDVKESYADISTIQNEIGFEPQTSIDIGIPRFVEWFKNYHGI